MKRLIAFLFAGIFAIGLVGSQPAYSDDTVRIALNTTGDVMQSDTITNWLERVASDRETSGNNDMSKIPTGPILAACYDSGVSCNKDSECCTGTCVEPPGICE